MLAINGVQVTVQRVEVRGVGTAKDGVTYAVRLPLVVDLEDTAAIPDAAVRRAMRALLEDQTERNAQGEEGKDTITVSLGRPMESGVYRLEQYESAESSAHAAEQLANVLDGAGDALPETTAQRVAEFTGSVAGAAKVQAVKGQLRARWVVEANVDRATLNTLCLCVQSEYSLLTIIGLQGSLGLDGDNDAEAKADPPAKAAKPAKAKATKADPKLAPIDMSLDPPAKTEGERARRKRRDENTLNQITGVAGHA